jgi:AraC-like DNA-binding protein
MNISLTSILFVLIIFQLLFLSFFLFTLDRGKRASNILVGSFFLAICLNLLDVFLLMTGFYFSNPALAGWGSCLPLLFGPLLYFYTQSIVYRDFAIAVRNQVHFLPFILFFSGTELYYLFLPREVQERLLRNLSEHHFPKPFSIVSVLIFVQFLSYAAGSLRLVSRYKKTASQLFSNRKHTDISWLFFTLLFFIVIMIITTLNGLFAQTPFAKYYLLAFNIVILILLVFINQVLLKALRRPYFFSFPSDPGSPGQPSSGEKPGLAEERRAVADNYQGGMEDDMGKPGERPGRVEKEKIVQTVMQFMQSNKPYLESELTLDQLASRLSLRPKILSLAINEIKGQNFFDFINRYRIEEAARLLTNPKDKKITILEVLYEVGFNSKSSFNTLFKKYTGLTPSEFRKKQPS